MTEQQERSRFDTARKWIGLVGGPIGLLLFVASGFADPPWLAPGLDQAQRLLAGVMVLVVFWWVGEVMPLAITGLIGTSLAVLLGVGGPIDSFAGYLHPLIFLFLGAFLLARAMQKQGLDRAIARTILGSPWIAGSPVRVLAAVGLIAGTFSAFISNTAAVAMAVPIVAGLLPDRVADPEREKARRRFQTGALLMLAFGATLGGLTTPVGTPPNAIGIGMIRERTEMSISFFRWMTVAFPIAIGLGAVLLLLLWWLFARGPVPLKEAVVEAEPETPAVRRARWAVFGCFMVCVAGWLAPDLSGLIMGADHAVTAWLRRALPTAVPPLLASGVLFLWPNSTSKTLLVRQDLLKLDWPTLLLFGSGLSLGSLMFNTGLAEVLGSSLGEGLGVESVWAMTALATAMAILLSEASSNTASANMVIPLAIGLAQAAGLPVMPPALGAALGASFGFMMPVSTPPNAIVYGTRQVPLLDMMRAGILLDVCGFIVIVAGLRIVCPLLGFA